MNSFSQNTSNQEQVIESFLRDYSNKPKDGHTIHVILSEACSYYDADRSYIFELNKEQPISAIPANCAVTERPQKLASFRTYPLRT